MIKLNYSNLTYLYPICYYSSRSQVNTELLEEKWVNFSSYESEIEDFNFYFALVCVKYILNFNKVIKTNDQLYLYSQLISKPKIST